jgi:hypothetical protein
MQEAEAKAAAAEEKERSVSERLSQSLSRITVLETQVCVLISNETKNYASITVLRSQFQIYDQVIFG